MKNKQIKNNQTYTFNEFQKEFFPKTIQKKIIQDNASNFGQNIASKEIEALKRQLSNINKK
jgi:hypothetical protein